MDLSEQNLEDFDYYDFIEHKVIDIPIDLADVLKHLNSYILELNLSKNKIISDDEIYRIIESQMNEEFKNKLKDLIDEPKFIKMHRLPKDSYYEEKDKESDDKWLDYLKCESVKDVVVRLAKSLRIIEDIDYYIEKKLPLKLYLMLYNKPDLNKEFRVFIYNGKIIGISQVPESQVTQINIDKIKFLEDDFGKKFQRCCIDIEYSNNKVRIFEINPFDCTTDLYNFTEEKLEEAIKNDSVIIS